MRIYREKDYEAMSRRAADLIAAQVMMKPDCVLGLATGSTPEGAYRYLAEKYQKGELDFSAVHTVNLDEYCGMGAEHDQSYAYFMNQHLLSKVNIRKENTNIPNGLNADAAAECARYDRVIEALGGVDLQLLGIGNNGHIGFNEPADSFATGTHQIQLTEGTREANARFFNSLEEVPTAAYTMGNRAILQAKTVLLVASGKAKAKAVRDAFAGPVTPAVPASVLQFHPNVILVADEEALSLLCEEKII